MAALPGTRQARGHLTSVFMALQRGEPPEHQQEVGTFRDCMFGTWLVGSPAPPGLTGAMERKLLHPALVSGLCICLSFSSHQSNHSLSLYVPCSSGSQLP